jgi:hypothetical protein
LCSCSWCAYDPCVITHSLSLHWGGGGGGVHVCMSLHIRCATSRICSHTAYAHSQVVVFLSGSAPCCNRLWVQALGALLCISSCSCVCAPGPYDFKQRKGFHSLCYALMCSCSVPALNVRIPVSSVLTKVVILLCVTLTQPECYCFRCASLAYSPIGCAHAPGVPVSSCF